MINLFGTSNSRLLISPIFYEQLFIYLSVTRSVCVCTFLEKETGIETAHKMLLKLILGVYFTNIQLAAYEQRLHLYSFDKK